MAIQKKVSDVNTALDTSKKPPKTKDTKKKSKKTEDPAKDKKVGYFRGSWRELKRVTWPGRKESWIMTFGVIVFTLLFTAYTTGLDFILERVVRQIFL